MKFSSWFALIEGLYYDHEEMSLYDHSQCWALEQPPCTPPTQITH